MGAVAGTLIILLTLVVAAVLVASGRIGGFPYGPFYARGLESGFSLKEVHLLRRLAQANRLTDATALFWSTPALDRCLATAVRGFMRADVATHASTIGFLSRAFDLRSRIELEGIDAARGLRTSRAIAVGQPIKLIPTGSPAIATHVVENTRRGLSVLAPPRTPGMPSRDRRGDSLQAYFWRESDAGYFFESVIVADQFDGSPALLIIRHSEDLIRTQKRRAVRRACTFLASILPIPDGALPDALAAEAGYRCRMRDLSESGAAVVVAGVIPDGQAVRLIVPLPNGDAEMVGVVRAADSSGRRTTVLHVESTALSPISRIRILTWIYGLLPHDPQPEPTGDSVEPTPSDD